MPKELTRDSGFSDIRAKRARERGAIDPLVIVSADSHVSLPPEEYIAYLDPKYRIYADEHRRLIEDYHEFFTLLGYPYTQEVLDVIDTRGAIRGGGELGTFDPDRRLRETEAEGIVAEFLHPDGPLGVVPFFHSVCPVSSPELRAAGARAHNRFLNDFCSVSPERLLGVHLVYPWPDMDAAVEDCRLAAEAGAKAVYPPQQAGVPGDPSPAFYDPSYDPFWAACQDLGLAVHIHAGWGHPQGSLEPLAAGARTAVESGDSTALAALLDTFVERRPLWQLMFGGVFDRFPRLKVSFVEIHCDWVPETLAYLDRYVSTHQTNLDMMPTEYWQRHCAIGASVARYTDVAVRHQVGVDKVLFGTDYPHVEGMWPNTRLWIREMLGGLPEPEMRGILGENAIRFYNLDRGVLDTTALRCGLLPSDVIGGQPVGPEILDHFNATSGIRKPVGLHLDDLRVAVSEDYAGAAASGSNQAH